MNCFEFDIFCFSFFENLSKSLLISSGMSFGGSLFGSLLRMVEGRGRGALDNLFVWAFKVKIGKF